MTSDPTTGPSTDPSTDPSAGPKHIDLTRGGILTPRLLLRHWQPEDATAALAVYGDPAVATQLSPALGRVADVEAMRLVLDQWIAEDARTSPPAGRWAVALRDGGQLVGGASLLPMPPVGEDLEFGWQIHPDHWGQGYAPEAGRALAHWAFEHGEDEVFAVVRAQNARAAAVAHRIGMEWVGETAKYYGLTLQVYRLRLADLTAQEAVDEGMIADPYGNPTAGRAPGTGPSRSAGVA